jgi:hypothetical protein
MQTALFHRITCLGHFSVIEPYREGTKGRRMVKAIRTVSRCGPFLSRGRGLASISDLSSVK